MARVIEGIALIAGAIGLALLAVFQPEITGILFTVLEDVAGGLGILGASLTLGGIAQALQANASTPFSVRQAAAARACIYGEVRMAGTIVYISTTNGGEKLNMVIVWAAHLVDSISTIYLDGRQLYLNGSHQGDGNTYTDDAGNQYSFGSTDVSACYHNLGTVPGTFFSALNTNDPTHWFTNCTLDGLASTYLCFGYDSNRFSGPPGVKATIFGRADIYDPRSGTTGYSNNAALVIANFLCDKDWGLGCVYANEIDQNQLIAAANICDEQVALAAGGYESRYTINGWFTTDSTPGEILDTLLQAMEGRISYVGGVWKIFPAAWYGAPLSFTQDDLVDKVQWSPARKYRDLCNTVRAKFICPRYPYAILGYDNDHRDTAIFDGQWQPTDIPEYAQDPAHGYGSDANLTQDGGVKLYVTREYRFTTSVSMAQRLAKIYLLRNRMQGSGTLSMQIAAYQMTAQDVFQFTFPALSMTNQYLEIQNMRLVPKVDEEGKEAPVLYCEVNVNATDPSVYYWSTAEERTLSNADSPTLHDAYTVQPPTGLTLTSGTAEAVVGQDGIILPRILIQWTSPADPFVASGGYIEIQWQVNGAGSWTGLAQASPLLNSYYLSGIVAGQAYNVQMRSVRANGASSAWVLAGPETASSTGSLISYARGANCVANYGFETDILGGPVGDSWEIQVNIPSGFWTIQREDMGVGSPFQHSGAANLLIRVNPSQTCPTGGSVATARVFSNFIPISGNEAFYYGGYVKWDYNTPLNASLHYIQRIGLYFYDSNNVQISEFFTDQNDDQTGYYQLVSGTCVSPSNAAFLYMQCSGFVENLSGSTQTTPAGLSADLRFDDVFCQQQTNSGVLTGQGSIQPTQSLEIPYSVTANSVTFTWGSLSMLRSDGSTLSIPSGSLSYSGLSASTMYYTYWYADPYSGTLSQTNGAPPPTSPNALMAAQAGIDGRVMVGTISFTTTASGSGSGTGGGGDVCPESNETVYVLGRGEIKAGDVKAGDSLKGYSFKLQQNVYRRVRQVHRESCVSWRHVKGHRVSPCEPVYVDGKWQAAYRVSAEVDTFSGYKVKISVDADQDAEMNYWLVGEEELLIHNIRISPC